MGSSLSRVAMPGAEVGLRGGFSQGPVGLGKAERRQGCDRHCAPLSSDSLSAFIPLGLAGHPFVGIRDAPT